MGIVHSRAKFHEFLRRHRAIGIDSNILIYWIEDHKTYAPLLESFFDWLDGKGNRGVTSTLTMLEILVQPYRDARQELVDAFYGLLVTYPNLKWQDLTLHVADLAARLRADYNLRAPDVIQVASAMYAGCTGFLGNDLDFKRIADLEMMILDRSIKK